LFIPAKNKKDKKTWVGVSDQTEILVEYGLTSFGDFQNWVAVTCNTAFANTGSIITKSFEYRTLTIKWLATISRTQRFLKKDKFQVDCHAAYLDWLKTAAKNGKSEDNLTLTMPNPSDTIKQAAKEDLLAAHAAHQQAMKDTSAKQKSAAGEDEEDYLDDEELDVPNLTNVKCDRHLPVHIDPANPHWYILITLEACQEWGRALVSLYFSFNSCMEQTPGVTPKSPPQLLPYITLKGAKQAKMNELAPDPSPGGSGANTIMPAQHQARLNVNSPLSSPPNETHLKGHIDFLGIRNKEDTLSKLIANGFNSHKVFKSPGLLCSELRELGLNLGVVTVLFDNVGNFRLSSNLVAEFAFDSLKNINSNRSKNDLVMTSLTNIISTRSKAKTPHKNPCLPCIYLIFFFLSQSKSHCQIIGPSANFGQQLESNDEDQCIIMMHRIWVQEVQSSPPADWLLRSEVRELGMTLGVVTVFFDNVVKCNKYLASQNHFWLSSNLMAEFSFDSLKYTNSDRSKNGLVMTSLTNIISNHSKAMTLPPQKPPAYLVSISFLFSYHKASEMKAKVMIASNLITN
ncbi:hypothetical protein VP01_551g7, partial [Puccinia sorghi]